MPTITGTVVQTSPIPTQTVTGDVLHYYATTTQTLGSLTQAATGNHDLRIATATQSLSAVTQAATGNHDLRIATTAQTLLTVTQASTGTHLKTYTVTAAHTLPVLAQAAVANFAFRLRTTAIASDLMLVTQNFTHTDTLLASDTYSAIITNTITDSALVSGDPSFEVDIRINETGFTASSVMSESLTVLLAPKGAKASSLVYPFFSATLIDTFTASDAQNTILEATLRGTAYASDVIVATGVLNQTLTQTIRASDVLSYFLSGEITDTAIFADTLTTIRIGTELLTDSATVADTQVTIVRVFEELLDSANADNLITFDGSILNNILVGTAVASGLPWARDYEAIAWILNTESGGLSTYGNCGFTSIVEYGGVLIATSPDGVFALSGDDDIGRLIEAQIRTGFLDFGTAHTKRISDIFVGYTGGELKFDVETYDLPGEVYTYSMEEREAGAPRNNRVKPGRGLSSRYWRFSIQNVDGADFQLYDVTPNVATSKRRL